MSHALTNGQITHKAQVVATGFFIYMYRINNLACTGS